MLIMVNSRNYRSYICKECGDPVNFDYADDMMKKYALCSKCLDKKIAEEGRA